MQRMIPASSSSGSLSPDSSSSSAAIVAVLWLVGLDVELVEESRLRALLELVVDGDGAVAPTLADMCMCVLLRLRLLALSSVMD